MSEYVVKVGVFYVMRDGSLSTRQRDALRIPTPVMNLDAPRPRIVKLTTPADQTGDAMRRLADDILDDK